MCDGSRKDYREALGDKNEEDISDKQIERDNEVSIEEEKENEQNNEGDESLGEYEDDFDPADRKDNDSFDNKEAHVENKDELEEQEKEIEQEKGREQEEIKKEGEEEEEFEEEGEDEIVEDEQVKLPAGDNEEFRQKQSYGTKVVHEDENENTAVPDEEIEHFQHNRDEEEQDEPEDHKELDEQEERDKQEEERKQEQQNEQDDLEEQDEEVEKYRKLVNKTEGSESVQSEANAVTRSENGAESMKYYDYKKAQMHEISDEDKQENEGVPLNEIKKNEDLAMGEEEANKGTPSNENKSREKMVAKSEIVDRQTQNNSVDSIKRQDTFIKEGQLGRFAAAQEKTIKTESVSNRSIERKNGSEVLEGPSDDEQEKEVNTEVKDVNNKNAASTEEEKSDVNGSNKAERPTGGDISVFSRNEEENMGERKEQEDEVTEEAPSTGTGAELDAKGSELATAERHVGESKINSTKKDEKRAGAAIQDIESDNVKHLKEGSANKTNEADKVKSQNSSEMNTEEKDKRGQTSEKVPEMNEGVELPTDNVGKESAVKVNQNINVTEAREMDDDKTTTNKEVEPESFNVEDDEREKPTESSEQKSHETEKVSNKNEASKL